MPPRRVPIGVRSVQSRLRRASLHQTRGGWTSASARCASAPRPSATGSTGRPVLEGAGDGPDAGAHYAKHFVENARHGVGLIIQGSSCITPEGRTSPGMTCVDTREKVLRLGDMVDAVHREGASIFLQVGHGGLYAMEAWHEPYASRRRGPDPRGVAGAVAAAPGVRRGAGARDDDRRRRRDGGALRRRRGVGARGRDTTGCSSARPTPSCSTSSSRRSTTAAPTATADRSRRARRCSRAIRAAVAERAGADFPCTVKVPVETAPPGLPARDARRGAAARDAGARSGASTRSRRSRCRCSRTRRCRAARSPTRSGPTRASPSGSAAAAPTPPPARGHQGRRVVGRPARAVRAGVEPRPVPRGEAARRHPGARGRWHPHRRRGARDPRRRRGRPRRRRPARSTRSPTSPAGSSDADDGAGAVPELQPVCARADARHEGRLLQPRRHEAERVPDGDGVQGPLHRRRGRAPARTVLGRSRSGSSSASNPTTGPSPTSRGPTSQHRVWMNPVPEPKTVKQRMHLDVHARIGRRAPRVGRDRARRRLVPLDGDGRPRGWGVLPLRPGRAAGVPALRVGGRRGRAGGDRRLVGRACSARGSSTTTRASRASSTSPARRSRRSCSLPVPEPKTVKNRIHIDVTTDDRRRARRRRRTAAATPATTRSTGTSWPTPRATSSARSRRDRHARRSCATPRSVA